MFNKNLKKFVEELGIKTPVTTLSKNLDVSKGTVSSILKGDRKAGDDFLNRFANFYNINVNDLKDDDLIINQISDNNEVKQIPFYDVDFFSGFTQIFNDQTIQPSYYFYLPEFHNAELAIKNSGKSMSKELGSDDILGLKQIKGWEDYFPQGEIYAVVTNNNLRTIKKVRRNKENTKLVLIPKPLDEDKFDYPDYEEVPINMVIALFQVVASTHSRKLAL